ncbi:hypothetical protein [Citrobacter freundii complex sp. CFNIH2]|uniref:hypothetical protein n=1 Tax=Citrobacter freundii complex sp. CFNIH2 TaxID=2066049 RepID=UPI0021CBAAE8|nr:hypothetical protein [Citrobacter freundii complex sp. CFNIH2]
MKPTYEQLQEQLENAKREFRSADITMQNLEAKCERLAAENAGLKSCAEFYSAGFRAEQARGAFGLEWKPTEQLLDDCGNIASDALKTPVTDAFLAEVRASAIPDGYVLVPQQIFLEPSDIESICSQCGDGHESGYGDFTDGLLWVGSIQRDDGSVVHGLHISSADYSEEGGVTVFEFAAQIRKGDAL